MLKIYFYFNPRSREGSDKVTKLSAHSNYKFQSTLPRRERQIQRRRTKICLGISIHAPAKGATFSGRVPTATHKLFQSTLPRRERHDNLYLVLENGEFQSTLPRRERPSAIFCYRSKLLISIHAPAKGATSDDDLPF